MPTLSDAQLAQLQQLVATLATDQATDDQAAAALATANTNATNAATALAAAQATKTASDTTVSNDILAIKNFVDGL